METKTRKRILIAAGVVLTCAVVLSLPGPLRLLAQTVESDGCRTYEFKLLGLIPLGQKTIHVPELKVKDEIVRELNRSAAPPSGIDLANAKMPMKILRGSEREYCVRFDWAGDTKRVEDYYATQLTDIRKSDEPGGFSMNGRAQDGSRVLVGVFAWYKVAGGPPAGTEFFLKVTRS